MALWLEQYLPDKPAQGRSKASTCARLALFHGLPNIPDYGDTGRSQFASRSSCAREWFYWPILRFMWQMVGATGIEPVTPSMSTRCSPAELRALKSDVTGWGSYIGSKAGRQGCLAGVRI